MSWLDKILKKNQANELVPQAYSEAAQDYEALKSTNGALHTQLSGRNLTQAPVHGAKTVTSVAASLFAGASRLANRNYISIYNESNNTVYIGGSGVTTTNGFPILPGETKTYSIDPTADFGIYAIAASNSAVRVEEGK